LAIHFWACLEWESSCDFIYRGVFGHRRVGRKS
jgi:hypothetical protein